MDANDILKNNVDKIFNQTNQIRKDDSPINYVHYAAVVKHPRYPGKFAIEVGGEFDSYLYLKKICKDEKAELEDCGLNKDMISKISKIKGKFSLTECEDIPRFKPEDLSKFVEEELNDMGFEDKFSKYITQGDIFYKPSNEITQSFSAHNNTTISNPVVVEGGISVSSRKASNREGTLAGMFNVDGQNNDNWYAITNKHILQGTEKEIISPGNSANGNVIGTVEDLKEDQNLDLAIIKLEKDKIRLGDYIQHNYFPLKENKNNLKLEIGMVVKKYGLKSGYKEGIILSTNATVRLGKNNIIKNQIMCTSIGEKGDSGSFLVSKDDEVIGLIFGENLNRHLSFANKFSDIKECLNKNNLKFKSFISK